MKGREICRTAALADGGEGVEFEVMRRGELLPAFAVRSKGVVYAYINRCSHMELKLNFLHPDFFDIDKRFLICSTHGALFEPETGACRGGPCNGIGLVPIGVTEHEGKVVLAEPEALVISNEEQP